LKEISFPDPKLTKIPVLYGGNFGPDLEKVAEYLHLTSEEVILLHCSKPYFIYMIGFMPGFPYMGELPDALITPRLKTPRLSVPAGSVAIAQKQTGIYPVESPGGWHILGRTLLNFLILKRNLRLSFGWEIWSNSIRSARKNFIHGIRRAHPPPQFALLRRTGSAQGMSCNPTHEKVGVTLCGCPRSLGWTE